MQPEQIIFPAIRLYRDNQARGELQLFRRQLVVELGGALLYSSAKKKMRYYKLIFAGLAALFLFLAACLWGHSISLATGLLTVSQAQLLKNLVGGICATLGGLALLIGASLRTDRDVAAHLMRRARRQLMSQYAKKRVDQGLHRLLKFGKAWTQAVVLKTAYREALHRMQEHHEEMLQIFEHIAHSAAMQSRTREHLLNQALSELNQKLQREILLFRNES